MAAPCHPGQAVKDLEDLGMKLESVPCDHAGFLPEKSPSPKRSHQNRHDGAGEEGRIEARVAQIRTHQIEGKPHLPTTTKKNCKNGVAKTWQAVLCYPRRRHVPKVEVKERKDQR